MAEHVIRHVVTLVSPDGRFGGPTKVALDIAAEQRRRGIDSSVFAGADGYETLPTDWQGVPLQLARSRRLVPGMGFATTVAPGLRRKVLRGLTGKEIFHVHLARDLVTLPIAMALRRRSLPYVIHTHGMIDASSKRSAHVVDSLMTARVVSAARTALVLTPEESREVARLSAGATPSVLFENGIPVHDDAEPRLRQGALFLGRLHPRKGATVFAAAAAELASRYPDDTFRIAGPDEGDLSNVRSALSGFPGGERVALVGSVPPDEVVDHMKSAEVFVQPAADEPFGMTILEAMSTGTPPIVHQTSALAPLISAARAGWTFGSVDELRIRLEEALNSPQTTAETGARARQLAHERFSMSQVVESLQDVYDAGA